MNAIELAIEALFADLNLGDGTRHVIMYVDHHDRAYTWAERRKFERHPVTGSAQIVEFEEVVREEIIHVKREIAAPPLFADEDDEYLLSLGVPQAYLAAVKQVDEDAVRALRAPSRRGTRSAFGTSRR